MRRGIALLSLALCLSACATTSSPATTVYSLESDYVGALTLAVAYKDLPPCGTGIAVCSDPAVVARLVKAERIATLSLATAEAGARAHPTTAAAVVAQAQADISAFQTIVAELK